MTSTAVLLIIIGLFVIINSQNLVGVFQGNKKFSFQGSKSTTPTNSAIKNASGTREQIQKDMSIHRSVSDTGY
jgi:hypothetical protein